MGPVTTPAGAPPAPWQPALLDLYRSDYPGLVRLAVLVGADRSVAEELVQDAFVAAHRTWDGVRDPLAYLRRAVVNRCHSWGRRQVLERPSILSRQAPKAACESADRRMIDGPATDRKRNDVRGTPGDRLHRRMRDRADPHDRKRNNGGIHGGCSLGLIRLCYPGSRSRAPFADGCKHMW